MEKELELLLSGLNTQMENVNKNIQAIKTAYTELKVLPSPEFMEGINRINQVAEKQTTTFQQFISTLQQKEPKVIPVFPEGFIKECNELLKENIQKLNAVSYPLVVEHKHNWNIRDWKYILAGSMSVLLMIVFAWWGCFQYFSNKKVNEQYHLLQIDYPQLIQRVDSVYHSNK